MTLWLLDVHIANPKVILSKHVHVTEFSVLRCTVRLYDRTNNFDSDHQLALRVRLLRRFMAHSWSLLYCHEAPAVIL
jgi:hypothetical protein